MKHLKIILHHLSLFCIAHRYLNIPDLADTDRGVCWTRAFLNPPYEGGGGCSRSSCYAMLCHAMRLDTFDSTRELLKKRRIRDRRWTARHGKKQGGKGRELRFGFSFGVGSHGRVSRIPKVEDRIIGGPGGVLGQGGNATTLAHPSSHHLDTSPSGARPRRRKGLGQKFVIRSPPTGIICLYGPAAASSGTTHHGGMRTTTTYTIDGGRGRVCMYVCTYARALTSRMRLLKAKEPAPTVFLWRVWVRIPWVLERGTSRGRERERNRPGAYALQRGHDTVVFSDYGELGRAEKKRGKKRKRKTGDGGDTAHIAFFFVLLSCVVDRGLHGGARIEHGCDMNKDSFHIQGSDEKQVGYLVWIKGSFLCGLYGMLAMWKWCCHFFFAKTSCMFGCDVGVFDFLLKKKKKKSYLWGGAGFVLDALSFYGVDFSRLSSGLTRKMGFTSRVWGKSPMTLSSTYGCDVVEALPEPRELKKGWVIVDWHLGHPKRSPEVACPYVVQPIYWDCIRREDTVYESIHNNPETTVPGCAHIYGYICIVGNTIHYHIILRHVGTRLLQEQSPLRDDAQMPKVMGSSEIQQPRAKILGLMN
ncbi:hypothetical protein CCUS01_09448 [Colletotrichum cuscutae]|uniref:Uncharacterized protein n=1 Tax=Colletotrichum cuscutae TaxID=1209917 RepID=A0AAI9UJR8_9PEZI|nr:hypothetical protein CCUS01_09448 [Colletotrichum cuscutae]